MYTQVAANKRKSLFLILIFILIVGGLGWIISKINGSAGFFVGVLIFAVIYALVSYFSSAKIALALSGAQPVTKQDAPELYRAVENLSITAGLPMPSVYVINDPGLNAFATGRDPAHAAVAATTGLLEVMDKTELEGVLAHELSHVGNYDIRLMGIVLVLVTVVAFVSDFFLRMTFWGGLGDDDNGSGNAVFFIIGIVAALIAPLVATMLQLAVSRKREYLADASGALLTRYPEGLANALTKIANSKQPMRHANNATAHLYFSAPLRRGRAHGFIANFFSTHPPIEERIQRLQEMENKV